MVKITKLLEECRRNGETAVSFEYFPAKTESGTRNLFKRIHEMNEKLRPTFISLTWRSSFKDEIHWLNIGSSLQKQLGVEVLLHLTCHLPEADLIRVLRNARQAGIQNILALRGDIHIKSSRKWRPCKGGFKNAIELVRLIRREHGDYFCVAVAGYPEVHLDSWNSDYLPPSNQSRLRDLKYLKEKIGAGADFVMTQFCFDASVYERFISECRQHQINVPIVPAYLPIQGYQSFKKLTTWCKSAVPPQVMRKLEEIKNNEDQVKAYGVECGVEHCSTLLEKSPLKAMHFQTLNLVSAVSEIMHRLKLVKTSELPWGTARRHDEEVRPIFWSFRPSSYMTRTAEWDEYPNGRWGDNKSAAYGNLTDYYLAKKQPVDRNDYLREWGVPTSVSQVTQVFINYMKGEINHLPWCDDSSLTEETSLIAEDLIWMNRKGFLTINSQPAVNGLPSTDKNLGWGGAGGYVFQKCYVEFFCSPENWAKLQALLRKHPLISYQAVNQQGKEYSNNFNFPRVNAVTWGVFPGREIIQPTVVDTESFRIWKSEAFDLWLSRWAALYETDNDIDEDDHENDPTEEFSLLHQEEEKRSSRRESESPLHNTADFACAKQVIQEIHDNWFLVNMVNNNYVSDPHSLFRIFRSLAYDHMSEPELRKHIEYLEEENTKIKQAMLKLESEVRELQAGRTNA